MVKPRNFFCTATLWLWGTIAGGADPLDPLVYRFEPGATLVYDVQIGIGPSASKESRSGRVVYTVGPPTERRFSLACQGSPNRRVSSAAAGYTEASFFRLWTSSDERSADLSYDQFGRLAGASGPAKDAPLLGDPRRLIVQPLDPDGRLRWHTTRETVIRVDKSISVLGTSHQTKLRFEADERIDLELAERSEETAVITRRYVLASKQKSGGQPLLSVQGEGRPVLDQPGGAAIEGEFHGKLLLRESDFDVEIPFRQTFRRVSEQQLAEERREAARTLGLSQRLKKIAATPSAARQPLADKALRRALDELKSTDAQVRIAAAERLALAKPTPRYAREVVAALDTLQYDPDDALLSALSRKATELWTTGALGGPRRQPAAEDRATIAGLIHRMVTAHDFRQRHAAIRALSRYEDQGAAEALAACLSTPDRQQASLALMAMGPVAAEAVARRLGENDRFVTKAAIEILTVIGTAKQVPALRAVSSDMEPSLERAAESAVQAIQRRTLVDTPTTK